jgi:hypothetical protein
MVEASTGQDLSATSAPESAGKEPINMTPSGNEDANGKDFLPWISYRNPFLMRLCRQISGR